MKFTSKIQQDIIALVTLSLAVCLTFFKIVFAPNQYLFTASGDGLKNYYTFAYYLQQDSGWWFSGMNYPYGEHISFTDNQPAFALLFNFIDDHLITIWPYSVGIINTLMLVSLVGCGFFIYKIIRFYQAPFVWAVLGGLLIAFLSPQLHRFNGHYALAHTAFIPMVWYAILTIGKRQSLLMNSVVLIFIIVFQSFVHLYYLAFHSALILAYIGGLCLFNFTQYKRTILALTGSFLVSCLVVLGTLKVTDNITDRPESPYGIEVYTSTFESVFSPNCGPLKEVINSGNQISEGFAYVGLWGFPMLLLIFIHLLFLWKGRKVFIFGHGDQRVQLLASMLAAGIVFFFATGDLNRWGLSLLNEVVPPLKQFRSLGRFAWIPYYVFTSFIWIQVYRWKKAWDTEGALRWLGRGLMALLLITYGLESRWHIECQTERIYNKNKALVAGSQAPYNDLILQSGYQHNDFQAILSLPFVLLGPEKIQVERGFWTAREAMACSFQTGIPMMNIVMSRTSVSQAMDLIEFLTPLPNKKRAELMNDQSILVLCEESLMTSNELTLLTKAQKIGSKESVTLYALSMQDLFPRPLLGNIDQVMDTLIRNNKLLQKSFNDESGPAFAGEAGLQFEGNKILWEGSLPDDEVYELSFWLKFDAKMDNRPNVIFRKINSNGIPTFETYFKYEEAIQAQKGWLKVEWSLDRSNPQDVFQVELRGQQSRIDEFQLKPKNKTTIVTSGNDTLVNNYLF